MSQMSVQTSVQSFCLRKDDDYILANASEKCFDKNMQIANDCSILKNEEQRKFSIYLNLTTFLDTWNEEDDCVENGQSVFWLINAWLGDID